MFTLTKNDYAKMMTMIDMTNDDLINDYLKVNRTTRKRLVKQQERVDPSNCVPPVKVGNSLKVKRFKGMPYGADPASEPVDCVGYPDKLVLPTIVYLSEWKLLLDAHLDNIDEDEEIPSYRRAIRIALPKLKAYANQYLAGRSENEKAEA